MSERRSFERRSFFRERNKSTAQFFLKERKVSAALKNWWARAQNALFLRSFLLVFGSETFFKNPHFS